MVDEMNENAFVVIVMRFVLVAVSDVTAHLTHSALHLWYMCSVCV